EHEIVGGERPPVVPAHVVPELEGQLEAVGRQVPRLGQLGNEVGVLVVADEAVVDEGDSVVGVLVARDVGNQPRDVGGQRLDQRVAGDGLATARRGGHVESALDLAPAARQRDGEQEQQQAGAHYFAGAGGGAGAAGVFAGAAGAGAV